MSIDKKAFGITEVHTPADLDESMISRYATQVVLGSKLKEMLDGNGTELDVEDNTELDTLTLTEDPDDTQSDEPTTEEPVTEDTITEDTITEEPVIEEPVIEEPAVTEENITEDTITDNTTEDPTPDDVIEDTLSNDQEEIAVDEENA